MSVTRKQLMRVLPPPAGRMDVVENRHTTSDIITQMLRQHEDNRKYAELIAPYFKGSTHTATMRNIYNFLRHQMQYQVEDAEQQTTKSLPAFIYQGYGDCKHFAGLFGNVLDVLHVPFKYRFATYDPNVSDPKHTYVVALDEQKKKLLAMPVSLFSIPKNVQPSNHLTRCHYTN